MPLRAIPCTIMRGGTSRGPYFLAKDLPSEIVERDRVLLSLMGSPDTRQIDGIGGADTLTSKVAIISKSDKPGVDVDYLFAQVNIAKPVVDTEPSCGNMLAGVGPFAIEAGLVPASGDETSVMIYNVNTQSRIEAVVQTPGGDVAYDGTARIDGVPGTSAPIILNFMDVVGSKTGALFPTGKRIDCIDGLDVTCADVAMPMMLVRAADVGISGHETGEELKANDDVLARLEPVRLIAGEMMGLGDVREKVIPKIGVLASPRHNGDIASRYYTPWSVHAAHAVTGAACVASASVVEGTLAHGLAAASNANPRDFVIEHPSGQISVRLKTRGSGMELDVVRAGILRTARMIMRGEVFARS